MKKSDFNNKVRGLCQCSLRKSHKSEKELACSIAQDLGMKDYKVCSVGYEATITMVYSFMKKLIRRKK